MPERTYTLQLPDLFAERLSRFQQRDDDSRDMAPARASKAETMTAPVMSSGVRTRRNVRPWSSLRAFVQM